MAPAGFIPHRVIFKYGLGRIWVAPVAIDILGGLRYYGICLGVFLCIWIYLHLVVCMCDGWIYVGTFGYVWVYVGTGLSLYIYMWIYALG